MRRLWVRQKDKAAPATRERPGAWHRKGYLPMQDDSTRREGRNENEGAHRAALSIALAVIVRAAERLPKGSPARRALADAARPLRHALWPSEAPDAGDDLREAVADASDRGTALAMLYLAQGYDVEQERSTGMLAAFIGRPDWREALPLP